LAANVAVVHAACGAFGQPTKTLFDLLRYSLARSNKQLDMPKTDNRVFLEMLQRFAAWELRDSGMDAENDSAHQRGKYFTLRLPADLYEAIERDAVSLGVSMSDAGRMRLRSGRCPSMSEDQSNG
jgi:hypothetical protein